MPCEDRGKDWSDVSTSQRIPRTVSNHKKQGERPRTDPSPATQEGIKFCLHLDFRLLVSQTMRQYISVVLNHPIFGNLLWQPKKTNTGTSPQIHSAMIIIQTV